MEKQLPFVVFKPLELKVPVNRLGSVEGFPFEFELGSTLVHEMGSSVEGSKNPMT
jgi:hypothetical protein